MAASAQTSDARPNIVFILADDLGYGDVRCLNPAGKIATPHLDALAATGMKFTDAHTSSSVCTPTRYGLMTGRYNWRTRLQKGVLSGMSPPLIDADRLTVAGLLRRRATTPRASANGTSAWSGRSWQARSRSISRSPSGAGR